MPYYRGDYYRGRRGDFWGAIRGAAVGFLSGGLPGAIAGGIGGAVGGSKPTGLVAGQGLPAPMTPPTITLPGGVGVNPGAILPGGKPFLTSSAGAVPPGWHWNKSSGYNANGRYEEGTFLVRNRSMNPANPRALRRSIRREQSFVALARRTLKGTGITIGRRSFAKKAKRR